MGNRPSMPEPDFTGGNHHYAYATSAKESAALEARLLPPGAQPTPPKVAGRVAVFFCHPTLSWVDTGLNSRPKLPQAAVDTLLRGELGPFLGLGPVSAPIYRNATLLAYHLPFDWGRGALERAGRDVERAFAAFLRELPAEMPFVLVGHSQGAEHLVRLMQLHFEADAWASAGWVAPGRWRPPTSAAAAQADAPAVEMPAPPAELRRRLVAAYLGGCQVGHDTFRVLHIARSADETVGVIPWVTTVAPRTFSALATGKGGRPFTSSYTHLTAAPVSVNMLSWTLRQGEVAPPEQHPGALVHLPPGWLLSGFRGNSGGATGSGRGTSRGGKLGLINVSAGSSANGNGKLRNGGDFSAGSNGNLAGTGSREDGSGSSSVNGNSASTGSGSCSDERIPYHPWYIGPGGVFARAQLSLQPGACGCVVNGEAAQVVSPAGAWLSWFDPLGFDRRDLHLVDFEVWWAPLRANAALRAERWLAQGGRYKGADDWAMTDGREPAADDVADGWRAM